MSVWDGAINLVAVTALGWGLVHFVWQGLLVALVLKLVLPLCRTARLRYGVACVAMLVMLVVFAVTAAVSIPDQRAAGPDIVPVTAVSPAGGSGEFGGRPPEIRMLIQGALPWVVPVWMALALLIVLYRAGGWAAAQRMRRVGVSAVPEEWRERLDRLARRVGLTKPVMLLESSLAEVPVVFGHLKPVILAPVGLLSGLPAEQVEAILLHELAHIRRHDYVMNLMQNAVESLLFYHPAVWWVSGVIRAERENCCDDLVVAERGDAHGYAAALVTLEERRSAGHEPALAATGGILMQRVRRLLGRAEEPLGGVALIVPAVLLLAGFALLAGAQQSDSGIDRAKSFSKWLSEDVLYIIEDRELAAAKALGTDDERERFIEQFWARRDTTPGTQANEFKIEHYRRITYANDRYRSDRPGWKTDRGRIYILHGPPDEIEAHPPVRELWMYRGFQATGKDLLVTFTDPDNSGELRMAGSPEVIEPRR